MNKSQLGSALSIQNTLLDFHLGKLTEVGLIVTRSSAQDREVLCFAAEDANLWDDERTRILYGRGQNRAVAMFLADHPGADTQEIAQALGMSCVTVRYHLRTLRDHTLVHKLQAGRRVLYAPDPVLEDWVARVGEPFDRPWHE